MGAIPVNGSVFGRYLDSRDGIAKIMREASWQVERKVQTLGRWYLLTNTEFNYKRLGMAA